MINNLQEKEQETRSNAHQAGLSPEALGPKILQMGHNLNSSDLGHSPPALPGASRPALKTTPRPTLKGPFGGADCKLADCFRARNLHPLEVLSERARSSISIYDPLPGSNHSASANQNKHSKRARDKPNFPDTEQDNLRFEIDSGPRDSANFAKQDEECRPTSETGQSDQVGFASLGETQSQPYEDSEGSLDEQDPYLSDLRRPIFEPRQGDTPGGRNEEASLTVTIESNRKRQLTVNIKLPYEQLIERIHGELILVSDPGGCQPARSDHLYSVAKSIANLCRAQLLEASCAQNNSAEPAHCSPRAPERRNSKGFGRPCRQTCYKARNNFHQQPTSTTATSWRRRGSSTGSCEQDWSRDKWHPSSTMRRESGYLMASPALNRERESARFRTNRTVADNSSSYRANRENRDMETAARCQQSPAQTSTQAQHQDRADRFGRSWRERRDEPRRPVSHTSRLQGSHGRSEGKGAGGGAAGPHAELEPAGGGGEGRRMGDMAQLESSESAASAGKGSADQINNKQTPSEQLSASNFNKTTQTPCTTIELERNSTDPPPPELLQGATSNLTFASHSTEQSADKKCNNHSKCSTELAKQEHKISSCRQDERRESNLEVKQSINYIAAGSESSISSDEATIMNGYHSPTSSRRGKLNSGEIESKSESCESDKMSHLLLMQQVVVVSQEPIQASALAKANNSNHEAASPIKRPANGLSNGQSQNFLECREGPSNETETKEPSLKLHLTPSRAISVKEAEVGAAGAKATLAKGEPIRPGGEPAPLSGSERDPDDKGPAAARVELRSADDLSTERQLRKQAARSESFDKPPEGQRNGRRRDQRRPLEASKSLPAEAGDADQASKSRRQPAEGSAGAGADGDGVESVAGQSVPEAAPSALAAGQPGAAQQAAGNGGGSLSIGSFGAGAGAGEGRSAGNAAGESKQGELFALSTEAGETARNATSQRGEEEAGASKSVSITKCQTPPAEGKAQARARAGAEPRLLQLAKRRPAAQTQQQQQRKQQQQVNSSRGSPNADISFNNKNRQTCNSKSSGKRNSENNADIPTWPVRAEAAQQALKPRSFASVVARNGEENNFSDDCNNNQLACNKQIANCAPCSRCESAEAGSEVGGMLEEGPERAPAPGSPQGAPAVVKTREIGAPTQTQPQQQTTTRPRSKVNNVDNNNDQEDSNTVLNENQASPAGRDSSNQEVQVGQDGPPAPPAPVPGGEGELRELAAQPASKPAPVNNRSILILREIEPNTAPAAVKAIFDSENCPSRPTHCEYALRNSWYVTFANDEDAKQALAFIRKYVIRWEGAPIMARFKPKPAVASASDRPPATALSPASSTSTSNTAINLLGAPLANQPEAPPATEPTAYPAEGPLAHLAEPDQPQRPGADYSNPHYQQSLLAANPYGASSVFYYGNTGPLLGPYHYADGPQYHLSELFTYNSLAPVNGLPGQPDGGFQQAGYKPNRWPAVSGAMLSPGPSYNQRGQHHRHNKLNQQQHQAKSHNPAHQPHANGAAPKSYPNHIVKANKPAWAGPRGAQKGPNFDYKPPASNGRPNADYNQSKSSSLSSAQSSGSLNNNNNNNNNSPKRTRNVSTNNASTTVVEAGQKP